MNLKKNLSVQKALNAYQDLLFQYGNEIDNLQLGLDSIGEKRSDPASIINAHITNFDVYLLNSFHPSLYYEIKWRLIPLILKHIAAVEELSPEDLESFEQNKVVHEHSQSAALLLETYSPISKFAQDRIEEQKQKKDKLEYPWPPKKANATRQQQSYRENKEKYDHEIEQLDKCIAEMKTLEKLFKEEKAN